MFDLTRDSRSFDAPAPAHPGEKTAPSSQQAPLELTEMVKRFRVCWEVGPEYTIVRHEKRQNGFALELSGTHASGAEHPTPGCQSCQEVFAALQAIAVHILPREERDSAFEIGPYDQAIHYSPAHRNRPEVTLTIRIHHRSEFDGPVDACEVRCLGEMKQRLAELGACEGQWKLRKEN